MLADQASPGLVGLLRACAGNKEDLRQAARLEAARLRMAELGCERISYSHDSVFRACL
jgi:hypothetical protein